MSLELAITILSFCVAGVAWKGIDIDKRLKALERYLDRG